LNFPQTVAGTDYQNMDSQNFEQRVRAFQNMNPQQQQAVLEQFQNKDPQQRQAAMQQFHNLDPQLQQDVMQQVQNVAPQMQPDVMPKFQGRDPEQMQAAMQQRMNASLREQMGITNDTEWALIAEKINAVRKPQTAVLADDSGLTEMISVLGMGGGRRGGGFQAMLGRPSPESDALKQAVEPDAPTGQIKTLTAKLKALRNENLTKLAPAQGELRAWLTTRREAMVTLAGRLD
jgi:hypothetical protein